MKKIYNNVLWGLAFVAIGVIALCSSLGLINISTFFRGWWTLFIIIPAISGLFSKNSWAFSTVALVFGVTMLLEKQELIKDGLVFGITAATAVIVIGINMIVSSFKKTKWKLPEYNEAGIENYNAIFSGQERKYFKEPFLGADILALFGGVQLDLTNAIINNDVRINVKSIFGGCELKVPSGVTIKTTETNIFGGVKNNCKNQLNNNITIYIESVSIFGGLTIK